MRTLGTVGSPVEAFRRFLGAEIEALAIGSAFLRKEEQDPSLKQKLGLAVGDELVPGIAIGPAPISLFWRKQFPG